MKSNDILNALSDVDDKYKKEAFEENADSIFDKSKNKGGISRIFKYVMSAAAILALCAFAVFIGVYSRRDNIAASMLEKGADIPHEFSKLELEKTSYSKDANGIQEQLPCFHQWWGSCPFPELVH